MTDQSRFYQSPQEFARWIATVAAITGHGEVARLDDNRAVITLGDGSVYSIEVQRLEAIDEDYPGQLATQRQLDADAAREAQWYEKSELLGSDWDDSDG